jgi:hypothetical protein
MVDQRCEHAIDVEPDEQGPRRGRNEPGELGSVVVGDHARSADCSVAGIG